jgi:hypothetical protein
MEENRIIRPMAVTISGFIIGILFIFKITSFSIFRLLDNPIAVKVPSMVAMIVANTAMETDTYTAFIMELSEIRFSYHRSEKPDIFVRDFDELKENTMVTIIGR